MTISPVRLLAAASGALLITSALAGCAPSAEGGPCDRSAPRNVGLVAGATANAPAPELPEGVVALLEESSQSNGNVTIVVPSGTPRNVGTTSLGSDANDASICVAQQENAVAQVAGYIEDLRAESPEVNFLDSIELAARGGGDRGNVVVVGNGLQTVHPLSFAAVEDLITADPKEVADDLKVRGELPPSLAGVTVYWAGLGDVAGDQSPLTISTRSNLTALWGAIVEAAGGTLVILPDPLTGAAPDGLPDVPEVLIPREDTKDDWTKPVVLRDGQLRFKPDSAQFVDPAQARGVLAELVPAILQSGQVITITGATSAQGSRDLNKNIALSLARAEAVKDVLVEGGVPADSLETNGVGHEWCGFMPEEGDEAGVAAAASENRKVILTTPGVGLCA